MYFMNNKKFNKYKVPIIIIIMQKYLPKMDNIIVTQCTQTIPSILFINKYLKFMKVETLGKLSTC